MTWKSVIPLSTATPKAKADVFHPLVEMERQMKGLFDDFFGRGVSGFSSLPTTMRAFSPSIDVTEDEEKLTVTAEVAGIEPKEIDITFDSGVLYLKGEKKTEKEEGGEGKNYYYLERSFGSFERAVPIHMEVDEDNIKADSKNGVLRITLPKSQESKSKKRKISVA